MTDDREYAERKREPLRARVRRQCLRILALAILPFVLILLAFLPEEF